MTWDKTALFCDLDGTLFNSQGVVSPENRAALEEYMAGGGLFAVSTGREPGNALTFLGDLPMNAPAVATNGAAVYDFAAGEYLHCWFMDRAPLLAFLTSLQAEFPEMELQVYTPSGICYCTPEERVHPQLLALHRPCRFTTLEALRDSDIFKCFLYAPARFEETLTRRLLAAESAGLCRHVPGTTDVGGPITYHELLPLDVSKGSAIRFLRTLPVMRGRTILAAGDFWNDYELLEEADEPIAPANAIPEIKAICRHVTVSNNEHIIPHILRDIIPKL